VVVVTDWLTAVAATDLPNIDRLVEPTGLAVIAAVENNLRSDELAGLLAQGWSADLQSEYWSGFRNDFGAIRGNSLAAIEVGVEVEVPGFPDFAAVEISTDGTTGRAILRLTETGWKVDFAATVGPALIGPLGEYIESSLNGDHAVVVADAYRVAVVPALEAAAALDPANSVLVFETEFIRQLVDS
jgi:hypothetical protein